jgi:hypothetical protein
MVLSELTNKELKSILRENDVRNYSKLNKKGLLKKVNQLIKAQNGGGKKSGKGGNKKYTLRDLIGGKPILGQTANPQPANPADASALPPAVASAPPLERSSQGKGQTETNNRENNKLSSEQPPQILNNASKNKPKDECGPCSIL